MSRIPTLPSSPPPAAPDPIEAPRTPVAGDLVRISVPSMAEGVVLRTDGVDGKGGGRVLVNTRHHDIAGTRFLPTWYPETAVRVVHRKAGAA